MPNISTRTAQTARRIVCWLVLAVVLSWWAGGVGASVPTAPTPEELPGPHVPPEIAPHLVRLAGQDGAERSAAITALGASGDPRLLPLFEALREGSLYVWHPPDGPRQAVIVGGKVEDAGQTAVPLFDAYSQDPIVSGDGTQLTLPLNELEEIEADRRLRQRLKPFIDNLRNRRNLASSDVTARRSAATDLGNLGNPEAIGWLEEALVNEPDRWVRHTMATSIQLLRMAQDDPHVRLAAVETLGELRAARALPALQELLQAEAGAVHPDPTLRAAVTAAVKRIEAWGTLTEVTETVFRGISLSSILLLMALGLAVIFGLMGVINMAHGELMMLGAYATFLVQEGFKAYLPVQMFERW